MAEKKNEESSFRPEIKLEAGDSANDWMELLSELRESGDENEVPVSSEESKSNSEVKEISLTDSSPDLEEKQRRRARYEELCRSPSMSMKKTDMLVMSEFSEIIGQVNKAGKALNVLRKQHPDLLIPRIANTCVENLKETSQIMLREFHSMRHGREQKKYDARYVCAKCHTVFMSPLPADRICDECRASLTPRSAPY